MIIGYFIIISSAQTKIEWYDAPLFPLLALLVGLAINYAFHFIKDLELSRGKLSHNVLPFIALFLIFITPYRTIFDKTYKPVESPEDAEYYEMAHYLKDALRDRINLEDALLVYDGYNAHLDFYVMKLNEKGIPLRVAAWDNLRGGDEVFTFHDVIKENLKQTYELELVKEKGLVSTYKILGPK
jgi:hypothetical protein